MVKLIISYCILGLVISCSVTKNITSSQNHKVNESIYQNETKLQKEIVVLMGRGGCCSGHVISIDRNGEIDYFVGSYPIPNDSSDMPEKYDSRLIKQNPNYKLKKQKLSEYKISQLGKLLKDEPKLSFKDEVQVEDDFVYNLYLDNKRIASGYESRMAEFPENLRVLIGIVRSEVELYELPGMA